jgi:asparagine synthase (glutamine-hydrolysing)
MCGIVGIVDLRSEREFGRELIDRMNKVQHHRGPDETGVQIEPGLALGHKRLSIIDLANGQQPMVSADGRYVIIYNGEVYNFRELRAELEPLGHVFKTHCDTEVLLCAFAQWGEGCVTRFRGMFAFAIWDRHAKSLFLARDRLGIKPMFWCELPDGCVAFSSELKSLFELPNLPREMDVRAVEEYFALGYVPEPRTIFSGVNKLSPGYMLTLTRGQSAAARPKQYWDVPFEPMHGADATEEDLGQELIERLREAVKVRLVSEVPLGAFLSGGVDSSAVVAMMAGLSDEPVKTCSISFGDRAYNESEYADRIAERYSTEHRTRQVEANDFELIDQLVGLYDEPFADSSAMPTYRVCQLAREKVVVALSGDGGDENLAGYRRQRWHMNEESIRGRIPSWLRRGVFGPAGAIYPKMDWAPRWVRAKSTLQALARDSISAYFHSVSIVPDHLRRQLFSPQFNRSLGGYEACEVFREHARRAPTDDPLSLIQYLDLKTYLPGDILTKVDRASMAHALEVRVPLLDHQLVEWISGLSPNLKLRGQEGKYLLKKSLLPFVDKDIMYRPKMGFAIPIEHWFRNELRSQLRDRLLGSTLRETGIFDMRFLTRMVDDHQSGRSNHGPMLWSLLMFESFYRRSMMPAEAVGAALV